MSPKEGALVEVLVVEASRVFPCPKHVDIEGAAVLPFSGLVALNALLDQGAIKVIEV